MSFFSKLFNKQEPHSEYMQLELELEDIASSVGCSLPQLIGETRSFQDISSLVSIVGEERAEEVQKKHLRMQELFPLLTPEEQAYHCDDDLFDDWRKTVS